MGMILDRNEQTGFACSAGIPRKDCMNRAFAWMAMSAVALAAAAEAYRLSQAPALPPPPIAPPPVAAASSLPLPGSTHQTPTPAVAEPDVAPIEIETADLAHAGEQKDDNGLRIAFCWCPPGRFRMGNTPGSRWQFVDAAPVFVTLTHGFWMGKFEVTQGQWHSVMKTTLREQRARDPGQPRPVGDGSMREHVGEGPDHPIYFVSHAEAEEFCRKLTEDERRAGRLQPGWEYRLPTEAQWEFACRAGKSTITALGDRLSSSDANFDGTKPFNGAPSGPYPRETTRVGQYRANPWGLHDMHGNVWEWCRDGFNEKLTGGIDPVGVSSGRSWVMRGGCWHNSGFECLPANRGFSRTDSRGSGLGFRVALVSIQDQS
jgi:sulfatase modifying factor 1